MERLTRREFLGRSLASAAGLGAAGALLAACTGEEPGTRPPQDYLPILEDNPAVPAGLEPEGGPLVLFNYEGYLWKHVLRDFGERHGTRWEYETFFDADEAVGRMRSGAPFDIAVVPSERVPSLVREQLIQPINEEYLSNLGRIWRPVRDLEFDRGFRFSVPYVLVKAGVTWSRKRIDEEIGARPHPYDVFWEEGYRGTVSLPDSYRTGISVALLRRGIDVNTEDPGEIRAAQDDLLSSAAGIDLRDPSIRLAWSTDVPAACGCAATPELPALGFTFPEDPLVAMDAFVIPRSALHPVLAHSFLDHMLDPKVAAGNVAWMGAAQPVGGAEGAPGLEGLVRERDVVNGHVIGPISEQADGLWRAAWEEVKAALGQRRPTSS